MSTTKDESEETEVRKLDILGYAVEGARIQMEELEKDFGQGSSRYKTVNK